MKLSRCQQSLTACIAILAVLLLFVAPVVSRSLMSDQMMTGSMRGAMAEHLPVKNTGDMPAEPGTNAMPDMATMHNLHPMPEMDSASDMAAMPGMAAEADMDAMPAMEHRAMTHHPQPPPAPAAASGSHQMMDGGMMMGDGMIACGYCDLLIHVPLIIWLFVPLIWLLMTIRLVPPAAPVVAPRPRRPVRSQHPRAPPAFPSAYAL